MHDEYVLLREAVAMLRVPACDCCCLVWFWELVEDITMRIVSRVVNG